MSTLKDRILDLLAKSGKLDQAQIKKVLEAQRTEGGSLRDILVKEKLVSEQDLVVILSKELFIPFFDLKRYKIDALVVKFIPEHIARQHSLICVSKLGDTLTVAMSDPLNILALDDVKTLTGFEIDSVLSYEKDIKSAIDTYYSSELKPVDLESIDEQAKDSQGIKFLENDESSVELSDMFSESERPPVVKIVDLVILEALKKRASDIHIEPSEKSLRIRYRIDGQLHDVFSLPKKNQNAILARIKIISGIDITEARLPQDGRFRIRFSGGNTGAEKQELDVRVSALPCNFGQKFVLRLLDKANLSFGLDHLGFSAGPLALFKQAVSNPYGMILVTGPTGSGKSTTLYSIISQLNTVERNIVTVEDPVEYQVEGVTQIQVKPEIGLTFSNGLRGILRQNPDVIMVGEIRDSETADIAVKSSLTGQMVLSTLHTNDSIGAIARLMDMGIEQFLIASSLIAVVAQRLCRKICNGCKEPLTPDSDTLSNAGIKPSKGDVYYHGRGCDLCSHTGYRGRIAIIEVLLIDDTLRDMIIRKASADEIRDYAIKEKGMKTLYDDGLDKVKQGVATLEEVLRVTTED